MARRWLASSHFDSIRSRRAGRIAIIALLVPATQGSVRAFAFEGIVAGDYGRPGDDGASGGTQSGFSSEAGR